MQLNQIRESRQSKLVVYVIEAVISGIAIIVAHSVTNSNIPIISAMAIAILCYFMGITILQPTIIKFTDRSDLIVQQVFRTSVLNTALLAMAWYLIKFTSLPSSILVIYFLITAIGYASIRLMLRFQLAKLSYQALQNNDGNDKTVCHHEPIKAIHNRIIKRCVDLICSTSFLLTVFPIIYLVIAIMTISKKKSPIFNVCNEKSMESEEYTTFRFQREVCSIKFIKNMPMMLNVFLGEMSMVGPDAKANDVKPGIRTLSSKSDLWYRQNWNFWLDMRILIFNR